MISMNKNKIIKSTVCVLALAVSSLMAQTGNMMSTGASAAGPTIKSASKSVSGLLASTSAPIASSTREEDPILGMVFGELAEPKLAVYQGASEVELVDPYHSVDVDRFQMLKNYVKLLSQTFKFSFHQQIEIKVALHPLMKRRGEGVRLFEDKLWVSPQIIESKEIKEEISLALASSAYEMLDEQQQMTWNTLTGWTRHPLLPMIEKRKGFGSGREADRSTSQKEDFAHSLVDWMSHKSIASSRSLFFKQIYKEGYRPDAEQIAKLENVKINFAFISEKGWGGAAQGHCALVIEKDGVKRTVAYVSKFDWEQPLVSGLKSLVGVAPRYLEVLKHDRFVERYRKEGRYVEETSLNLSVEAKQRLFYRLRESFDFERGQYSFLRQNCANPLRDLLEYVCPEERKELAYWQTPRTLRGWAKSRKKGDPS